MDLNVAGSAPVVLGSLSNQSSGDDGDDGKWRGYVHYLQRLELLKPESQHDSSRLKVLGFQNRKEKTTKNRKQKKLLQKKSPIFFVMCPYMEAGAGRGRSQARSKSVMMQKLRVMGFWFGSGRLQGPLRLHPFQCIPHARKCDCVCRVGSASDEGVSSKVSHPPPICDTSLVTGTGPTC